MGRSRKAGGDRHEGRTCARVFWSGRSQAVRLPKAFRFSTKEVTIRQEGHSVVLEPIDIERDEKGWPEAWWRLAGAAPEFDVGDRRAMHERSDVFTDGDD
jgi:virulence-associated protein VagC